MVLAFMEARFSLGKAEEDEVYHLAIPIWRFAKSLLSVIELKYAEEQVNSK